MTDRRSHIIGILLLLAAAVLWSLNGALIKLVFDQGKGPHGITIAFYRSLIAGLFLLPLALRKFHTLAVRSNRPAAPDGESSVPSRKTWSIRPAALFCVVFFTLMTSCFVVASTMTEAANAIILQYTSTFWVFALSPLVLNERPSGEDRWLLILALTGVAVIFAGQMGTNLAGLIVALGAGLFYGLETLMIRRLRDCDAAAVVVLNLLGSSFLLLLPMIWIGTFMLSNREWVLLITLGVVQFGLPYYFFALALKRVTAYHAALVTLAEPILVPVWTYLAVAEGVPLPTVIGGCVILLALMLLIQRTRRRGGKQEVVERWPKETEKIQAASLGDEQ